MNTNAFLAGFRDNPDFLLQNINFHTRAGLLVKISESTYRTAAFLDGRILTKETQGAWFPLETLYEHATAGPAPLTPHYIAHVGHCGSTLISRLLAEPPGNLPVREPTALLALGVVRRELGQPTSWLDPAQWQRYYALATRSLARTYRSGEHAIIKLTSTAGNLLEPMLESGPPPRLLLMYVRLETQLATMLRTPDMRDSVHSYAPQWVTDFRRLTGRDNIRLAELSDAQMITVKWLTLMLLFTRAQTAHSVETRLLDFDNFLKRPSEELSAIARHFDLSSDTANIERLVTGPLMQRYSKIPEQAFTPKQRAQELSEARRRFNDEIQTGLRWAEQLCSNTPTLAALTVYIS